MVLLSQAHLLRHVREVVDVEVEFRVSDVGVVDCTAMVGA